MKKINPIILVSVVLLMSYSCNDVLNIKPVENNTADKFYSSETEIQQAVLGIYSHLGKDGGSTDFPTDYFWLASDGRADVMYIATEGPNVTNDQLDFRKYLITPNSSTVTGIFARLYRIIKDANNLLYYTDASKYARYCAEARFLRAYAYSELARTFGPVAITTEPITNSSAARALPRAPLSDIYALIISDLQYAAAHLDQVYTGSESGRVGSLAANVLLAQVYVTMGGYPYKDASAYAKAEAVLFPLLGVISTRFSPIYADIFTLPNENKYDLFSVQFASGLSSKGLAGSSLPGFITTSSASGTPFPEWTYNSYTQQGRDVRVDSTVVKQMLATNDQRFAASIDTGFIGNVASQTWVSKTIVTKFLEKDNTNTTIKAWNDFPRNFPILRPADAYLLYAEAAINNGHANLAKVYIDKIRSRAGLPPLATDPTMTDLMNERKLEFIGEGRRYFDLVRWGDTQAVTLLSNFATHYHSNTNGLMPSTRDLLLPIPQNELNTRDNWTQNEGY